MYGVNTGYECMVLYCGYECMVLILWLWMYGVNTVVMNVVNTVVMNVWC